MTKKQAIENIVLIFFRDNVKAELHESYAFDNVDLITIKVNDNYFQLKILDKQVYLVKANNNNIVLIGSFKQKGAAKYFKKVPDFWLILFNELTE